MRKLGGVFLLALDAVEFLVDNAFQLSLVAVSLFLALASLVGVVKGGGWGVGFALLLFSACAVVFTYDLFVRLGIVTHRFRRTIPPHRVSVSEAGVVSRHPNGTVERVSWEALEAVGLRAEDAYPIGSIYWVLIGAEETGCVVPSDAEGSEALLKAMQTRLPGFDSGAVIEAMGLLEGGREVWRRPGGGSALPPKSHAPEP